MEFITAQQIADMIEGRKYGEEITKEIEAIAKDNDILILFGASDDLLEFRGAVHDEYDCHRGGYCYVTKKGRITKKAKNTRLKIEALWGGDASGEVSWEIIPDTTHVRFNIFDQCGEHYCIGAVVDLKGFLKHEANETPG